MLVTVVVIGLLAAIVIPDSLGGVAATTPLLREGIVVPGGAFAGKRFVLPGILGTDIGEFLSVQYFATELKSVFHDPTWIDNRRPSRTRSKCSAS